MFAIFELLLNNNPYNIFIFFIVQYQNIINFIKLLLKF